MFMGVGRHLGFSTSGFLPVSSSGEDTCPIGMADPENIGIAVGIALLYSLEAEIYVFSWV